MTEDQILSLHVPIWDDSLSANFYLGCSCGWNKAADGHLTSGWQHGMEDIATEDWLRHFENSARLTRAAMALASDA